MAGLVLTSGLMPAMAIERVVTFRDGTRLQLDLPPFELTLNPAEPDQPGSGLRVPLEKASQITFSEIPALKRVERINASLAQLRHEQFAVRESAALALTKFGSGFRVMLEETLDKSFDPEIKWRLRRILKAMPVYAGDDFDRVRLGGNSYAGELAQWKIVSEYRGARIILDRKTVKSITAPDPTPDQVIYPVTTVSDRLVPLTARKIGFERKPSGELLRAGENIQRAFVDWGAVFSTSISQSYVSVSRYNIKGAGGGMSAATHEPLYEGSITIKFCTPGTAGKPAGVNFAGCWLGIVKPGGTSIIGYDVNGEEVGRVMTTKTGSQFLGVKSNVPLAMIKIVPNPEIDTNFAIDDLLFDTPTPLIGALKPLHYSVLLQDGNRISCKSIEHHNHESLTLTPGIAFAEKVVIPIRHVKSLFPPAELKQGRGNQEIAMWCRLVDGSTLLLDSSPDGQPVSRALNLTPSKLPLSSIWSSSRKMQGAPEGLSIPKGGAAIIMRSDPLYLTGYKLGNGKFTGKRPDGATVNYSYKRLPTIWIKEKADYTNPAGIIELIDGQRINFGKNCLAKSCTVAHKGVEIRLGENQHISNPESHAVTLNYSVIRSVHFK
ncbi:MAG: hypothetical protein MK183_00875 [Verrucomicrobiales bacterium]|nr:hypothetical protein [Verrucomicrobiales bacterium]